jgi:hypothetical protein
MSGKNKNSFGRFKGACPSCGDKDAENHGKCRCGAIARADGSAWFKPGVAVPDDGRNDGKTATTTPTTNTAKKGDTQNATQKDGKTDGKTTAGTDNQSTGGGTGKETGKCDPDDAFDPFWF